MKGKKNLLRFLAFFLSVAMIVTFVPVLPHVYGAEDDQAVQEEQQTEPTESSTQAEEPATVEAAPEKATEPKAESNDQSKDNAKDEAKAKSDVTNPEYTKDLDEVSVKVTTEENAFAEKVKLVVEPLEEDSDAFKDAEKALAKSEQTYDGILAYDIHFESKATGKEVEPDGTVSVEMKAKKEGLKEVAPKNFDADSVQVLHVVGKKAEVVADTNDKNKIDGTVEATKNEKAVQSIEAAFEVDSFSPYVITWTAEGEKQSATIHWGMYNEGEFKELQTPTTIDSTATNVDLNIIIDETKYYFTGAEYKLSADAEEHEALKSTVLKKENGVWMVSLDSGEKPVANGSHIYVYYAEYSDAHPYNPPKPPGSDVLAPETEKTVTENENGTYTIRLDVEGKSDHSTTQVGANVIVVMDITQSMTESMPGGGTRMAAAKQALTTLVNTLDPDKNQINFAAVNFGNNAQPYSVSFGTGANAKTWTTEKSDMLSYVNGLPNNPNDFGTCWQAGLRGGYNLANDARIDDNLKNNATYVIFVTDGNPNCYANNNDGSGRWHGSTGPGFDGDAYGAATYWANRLPGVSDFYGIFCGNAAGADHLEDLIQAAYNNEPDRYAGKFIDGRSTETIESAFENIATTIVNNLGAGGVTVDDGIPTLSNVSANVSAGEAGGFKYYIKPALGTESEWEDAPGASYSQTNGVTWDLGEAGELKNGWIYSLEFTVWPSQAAYDLIADLNNGKISYADLTPEQKATVDGSEDTGYTLKTNTHLYTTFTDLDGKTYKETNDATPKAMDLPTETISVKKLWHNWLDSRDDLDIDGLQLVLNRDDEEYLEFDVSAPSWKKEGIYISCGQIVDGVVKEKGHDYYVTEKAKSENNDKTEYWEVDSPKYHPMVVQGKMQLFVQDDDVSSPAFEVNGHKYRAATDTEQSLTAVNERVSWLNLTKSNVRDTVEGHSSADTLFEYTVTITEPTKEGEAAPDIYFSVRGGGVDYRDDITTTGTTTWVDSEGNTYYVAKSGTPFTLKIKRGWNARFLNLATGTTYSVQETNLPAGYALDTKDDSTTEEVENAVKNVETFYVGRNASGRIIADGYPKTVTSATDPVSGEVKQTNTDYSVSYRNVYEETSKEITKTWVLPTGQTTPDITPEQFKQYVKLTANGNDVTNDYASDLTVTQDSSNKLVYKVKYDKLPKYIGGEEVTYTITEDEQALEGYTAETDRQGNITNTKDMGNLTIKKVIDPTTVTIDADTAAKMKFTVTNTSGFEKTVYYNQFTNGSYTFNNVAVGEYTVVESNADIPGYTLTTTYSAEGGKVTVAKGQTAEITVTNKYECTEFTATKVWDDNSNAKEKRPATIQLQLKQNDKPYGDPVTVGLDDEGEPLAGTTVSTDGNSWSYTWKPLETMVEEKDAVYTVDEVEVPTGYEETVSADGKTITNKYSIKELSLTKIVNAYVQHPGGVYPSFAFRVIGYDGDENEVLNTVLGIDFKNFQSGEDQKTRSLTLPGTVVKVEVEELNSGNYTLDGEKVRVDEDSDGDGVFKFEFENKIPDNPPPPPYNSGVVNNYVKGENGYNHPNGQ